MKQLRGIPAAGGISYGPIFIPTPNLEVVIPTYTILQEQSGYEWQRFLAALEATKKELQFLKAQTLQKVGKAEAAIFDSHLQMLSDPDMLTTLENRLLGSLHNIEKIIVGFRDELVTKLGETTDSLFHDRIADIRDIFHKVLAKLSAGKDTKTAMSIPKGCILVCKELLPSELLHIDGVGGIICETGGTTGHLAILARAYRIPAILGVENVLLELEGCTYAIMDGHEGLVLANPNKASIYYYEQKKKHQKITTAKELETSALPVTKDGKRIRVMANVGQVEEAKMAKEYGAEGVGLFRSEYLFLSGHIPNEEEQFTSYSQVQNIFAMQKAPVTFRTLDIGGDKSITFLGPKEEKNPLLGWRAIRYCLSDPPLFKTQLRAILRCSARGNVRLMFPMIATPEELDESLALLAQSKEECSKAGWAYDENIKVGIMIEIPSAALTCDILAPHCDFFSIGTNDLTQYTLAVDRDNDKVSHLHLPYHPAMIRLIKHIIDSATKSSTHLSMCGEMAGDPLLIPLLLGLGMEELSMSPSLIPAAKKIIANVQIEDAKALAEKILCLSHAAQIRSSLEDWVRTTE